MSLTFSSLLNSMECLVGDLTSPGIQPRLAIPPVIQQGRHESQGLVTHP